MLKALSRLFRCGHERIIERRPAGLDPGSESLAKCADRTEFHRSRKLVTAALAGASILRFHGLTDLQPQTESERRSWCTNRAVPWRTIIPFHRQLHVA
jgi:hypothetical protein